MITKEQAMNLTYRQVLVDTNNHRWYVTGKCKTWKTKPEKFRVPLKHGLYNYYELNELNAAFYRLEE